MLFSPSLRPHFSIQPIQLSPWGRWKLAISSGYPQDWTWIWMAPISNKSYSICQSLPSFSPNPTADSTYIPWFLSIFQYPLVAHWSSTWFPRFDHTMSKYYSSPSWQLYQSTPYSTTNTCQPIAMKYPCSWPWKNQLTRFPAWIHVTSFPFQ